jgi:hypothetical protein
MLERYLKRTGKESSLSEQIDLDDKIIEINEYEF